METFKQYTKGLTADYCAISEIIDDTTFDQNEMVLKKLGSKYELPLNRTLDELAYNLKEKIRTELENTTQSLNYFIQKRRDFDNA